MFNSTYAKVGMVLLTVIAFVFAPGAWAWSPGVEPGEKITDNVTIYEGQKAVELYAKARGLSVDEAKKRIETATQPLNSRVENHLSVYVPPCSNPPHGAAYALFGTGFGPFDINFHGTKLWAKPEFCKYDTCTYLAWGGLPFKGDSIWLYSVTSAFSVDIDHWCSPAPSVTKRPDEQ